MASTPFRAIFTAVTLSGALFLLACSGDGRSSNPTPATQGTATGPAATALASTATASATLTPATNSPPAVVAPATAVPPADTEAPDAATPTPTLAVPATDRPPATTATADGASVEAGIGTYCWISVCVDKIGVPTLGQLTVSAGDTVTITIPEGVPPLKEAGANVFAAVDATPLPDGSTIWLYPAGPGESVDAVIASDGVAVTVSQAPGQYVLAVSLFFESGDVVYGVLLDVQ